MRLAIDARPGGRVRFVVQDDGPGIPADQRERVFNRFHRTDAARDRASGGAGLGLAIVRAIADAHGGAVTAGSSPEGGASIELELPGFIAGAGSSGPPRRLLGDEHRRAREAALAQILERPCRPARADRCSRGCAPAPRGASASISCRVAAGEVRDRAHGPLLPQVAVGEGGDVAHVDPAADDGPAGRQRSQRERHELADGREDDRRAQRLGWGLLGGARPLGAELAGELLGRRRRPRA